jgi:hypothetical protein
MLLWRQPVPDKLMPCIHGDASRVRGQREERRRGAVGRERIHSHNDARGHGSLRGAAERAREVGERAVATA